jgi:hypothetical protein
MVILREAHDLNIQDPIIKTYWSCDIKLSAGSPIPEDIRQILMKDSSQNSTHSKSIPITNPVYNHSVQA